MDSIPHNPLLKFKPGTLDYMRKKYNLDGRDRMKDAIRVLEEWIQKQAHFMKKDFRVTYLERAIINNKGSMEKCKKKIDTFLTLRTIIPELFESQDFTRNKFTNGFTEGFLTQMTPEYDRVLFIKHHGTMYQTEVVGYYIRYLILAAEYLELHDYSNSLIYFVDLRDVNMVDLVQGINVVELRKFLDIATQGCLRMKGFHFLSPSNTVHLIVSLFKQVLNAKMGKRIHSHKDLSSVFQIIPEDLFPEEYGGKEKPLKELCENLSKELTSEAFKEYKNELATACTNEALRMGGEFNNEYLGISGTFRALNVD